MTDHKNEEARHEFLSQNCKSSGVSNLMRDMRIVSNSNPNPMLITLELDHYDKTTKQYLVEKSHVLEMVRKLLR